MKTSMKTILSSTFCTAFLLASQDIRTRAEDHGPSWSYDADKVSKWGDPKLHPEWEICSVGSLQSPIALGVGSYSTATRAPEFYYGKRTGVARNTGHTIQVDFPEEDMMAYLDGYPFLLSQLHFHSPSEEEIEGNKTEMVVHLVHKSFYKTGKIAVIAVLLELDKDLQKNINAQSPENRALKPVFDIMPSLSGDEGKNVDLDLTFFTPDDLSVYSFDGSFTTPPCTQGVKWYVMTRPVTLSKAQHETFTKLYPNNARPIQPARNRTIYYYQHKLDRP